MIEFINPFTGTTFWVADDRVDEYKAAGYSPVANLEKPKVEAKPVKAEKPSETVEAPAKVIKKATRKK